MAIPILFDEILLDPAVFQAPSFQGWPEFMNTVIRNPKTGVHKTNVNRFDPAEVLTVNMALLTPEQQAYFLRMWRGGYGSGVGFRVRVVYDYTALNHSQGTINAGETKSFQLTKTYTRPGVTARQDVRPIVKPVVSTNLAVGSVTLYEADGITPRIIQQPFAVRVGGATTGFTYTINNTNGALQVVSTTASGTVSADFTFDCPMCFTGNTIPFKHDVTSSEAQNVSFREILPAELGIVIS